MKNLKKLVAVVLTLAMIISSLAVSVSASIYSDVDTSSSYAEAVDILSSLNILKGDDEGKFNPDSDIKRSEFAAVVARALGQENAANGAKGFSKFADVSVEHWAVGYINWAAQQGIVNGRDANTFDPDSPVKYQEAVKMLVAALGYEPMAKVRGGYPTGYLVIAASNGITSGISLSSEANAPRKAVAQLTYNALDVPLMDATFITTSGNDEYAIYNGKNDYELRTILNYNLGIAKVKAKVTNTHKSDSKLVTRNADPKVELEVTSVYNDTWKNVSDLINYDIDKDGNREITPFIGSTNAAEYLGYTVVAYVGLDEDDDALLYAISPDLRSNSLIEIEKDIEEIKITKDSKWILEYWENIDTDRDMEDVELESTATVYINGTIADNDQVSDYTAEELEELIRTASKVVLMGERNTDIYDKIFLTVYNYAIVESVNAEEEIVTVKNGGSIDFNKDSYDDTFVATFTLDGEVISLSDIEENDVLNMAWAGNEVEASDSRYVDVIVTRKSIEGAVSEIKPGDTRDEDEYGIDGTFYKKEVSSFTKTLRAGDTGKFFLTVDNKIIDLQATDSRSNNYGFVVTFDSESKFGENTYSMKLFTKEGELQVYPVSANNLKVVYGDNSYTFGNNRTLKQQLLFETVVKTGDKYDYTKFTSNGAPGSVTVSSDSDKAGAQVAYDFNLAGKLESTNEQAYIADRFITYKVSNNEITEIRFAANSTADKDVFHRTNYSSNTYKATSNKFDKYLVGNSSKLFYIPVSENSAGKYYVNEDKIELKSFSSLEDDKSYDKSFVVDTDSNLYFGAAVLTKDMGFGGKNSGLAIVKSISRGLDSDGNDADKITFVQGGEEKTVAVSSNNFNGFRESEDFASTTIDSVTKMGRGDVFLYTLNGKEEISDIYMIYEADNREISEKIVANDGKLETDDEDIKISFGYVTYVGSYITLSDSRKRDNGLSIDLGYDFRDGSTSALFDEDKRSSSTGAITSFRDFSQLKASQQTTSATARKYLAVVKTDDGDATDVVEILLPSTMTDTAADDAVKANFLLN